MLHLTRACLAGLVLAASAAPAPAAQAISGAGATFPQPLYSRWAAAYGLATGDKVSYDGVGSGAGVAQVAAGRVAFGASDVPLAPRDLASRDLSQFPAVLGGIVAVVNLPGIDPGVVALDGPTLAAIYAGQVSTWSDARIADLNPNVRLPDVPLVAIHRSDPSGTTYVLTDYLARATGTATVPVSTAPAWPASTPRAAKGSDGMAAAVAATPGAVGYLEYSFARDAGLSYVDLRNAAGRVVQPTPASFAAAVAGVSWGDYLAASDKSLADRPAPAAWPITTATFVLVPAGAARAAERAADTAFFAWAFARGASIAGDMDYVPLPADAVEAIRRDWAR